MKKIILALLISTTVVTAQTKTVQSICKDANGWSVTYKDEAGVGKNIYYYLTGSDSIKADTLINVITRKVNAEAKAVGKVASVTLIDNTFTITGSVYSPFVKSYSQLTTEQKAIVDALKSKYNEVTGNTLTSLVTIFGSNKVTINGIEYDYATFAGAEFTNAIILANTLFSNR
jgi:hypothetical protein